MLIHKKNEYDQQIKDQNIENFDTYLVQQNDGLNLKELEMCNFEILQAIDNFEQNPNLFFKNISSFYKLAEEGFIKQKSFDEKVNLQHIINMIINTGNLALKINLKLPLDDIQKKLILLNYQSLTYLYNFFSSTKYIKVDKKIQAQERPKKNSIKFLATKRTKNLRQCEQIESKDMFDNKENTQIKNQYQDHQFNLKIFKKSDILLYLIEFVQNNNQKLEDLCTLSLNIINIFCNDSDICQQIHQLCFCKDLLHIIYNSKENLNLLLTRTCFEIIWNQIHRIGSKAIDPLITINSLHAVKEIFCYVICNSYKMEDKIIRNELLVLINYMFEHQIILDQIATSEKSELLDNMLQFERNYDQLNKFPLMDILLYLCTIDESVQKMKNKKIKAKRFFELGGEDLVCKKLIINSISIALKNSNNTTLQKLVENSQFTNTLFFYFQVYRGEQLNMDTRYSIAQIKEIQTEALQALEIFADKFEECFFQQDRVILFLKYLRNSQDDSKLLAILRVFEKLSTKGEDKKKIIAKKGTIDLLLYYINGCQRLKNIEDEYVLQIKTYCFSILANLCQNSVNNQFTFSQKGGIEILIENLKNNLLMKTERSSLYVIKLLQALKCCVLGNKNNEEQFLENEGVYILMDFLENSLNMHWKQILSCLCFLMQNQNSHRYFDDWNSQKTNINSTQLLIQIYILQDKKFHVQYDKGVLENCEQPLNPQKNKKKGLKNLSMALETQKSSNSFNKFIQSQEQSSFNIESYLIQYLQEEIQKIDLRGQIYCILSLVGFDRNELNQEEKQRMEIIRRYQSLKIGEIWKNIKQNLQQKNLQLPKEDLTQIENKVEEMDEILNICLQNQKFLQAEKLEQQQQDLDDFFDLIRNHKK